MSDSDDSVELGDGGAKLTHKPAKYGKGTTASHASGAAAYVEVTEHPQSRGVRFRYKSEGPSHGGLQGERSAKGRKTYPSIKIHNYEGPALIYVTLVTDQNPPQPHAHELVGKNCKDGRCVQEIRINRSMQIPFPNLSIQHVTKKSMLKTLEQRICENRFPFQEIPKKLPDEDVKAIQEEAKKRANDTPLSVVRLQFEVLLKPNGQTHRRLPPVLSQPIYDSKCPAAAALKICRIDRLSGCCRGNEEIFLLCEKVQKDDISVRFYEENHKGELLWEDEGRFSPQDVHRQYAIVFNTPAYKDRDIEHSVEVNIQLWRKSDNEFSEPVTFKYTPERDKEEIQRKRRKKIPMPSYNDGGAESRDNYRQSGVNMYSSNSTMIRNGTRSSSNTPTRQNSDNSSRLPAVLDSNVVSDCCAVIETTHQELPTNPFDRHRMKVVAHEMGEVSEYSKYVPVTSVDDARPDEKRESGVKGERDVACQTDYHPEEELKDRYTDSHKGTLAYNIAERSTAGLLQFAVTSELKSLLYVQRYLLGVKDDEGDTPLHIAVVNKNKDVAKTMVEVAATIHDSDFLNLTNADGQSAVHLAVVCKQHEVLDTLLQCHADPSIQDKDGNTAAHIIAIEDNKKCMDVLIKHRDNKIYKDNVVDMSWANKKNLDGLTPLHLAVRCESSYCVKALLKAKVDPNIEDSKSGRTALHFCADVDNIGILGALLTDTEAHPDVNAKDFSGLTPLHIAVSRGSTGMAALLMLKGADPTAESGQTVRIESEEAEACDDTAGAGVDAPSSSEDQGRFRGETPMDIAKQLKGSKEKREKLIKILEGVSYAALSPVARAMKDIKVHPSDELPSIGVLYDSLAKFGVQALPQGDIVNLQFGVRYRLAQVLDKDNTAHGWRGLAEKINLDGVIEPMGRQKSPTMALLDNYEVIDGTVAELKDALKAINRQELLKILEQYPPKPTTKRGHQKGSGPKSLDSGYLSHVTSSAPEPRSLKQT